MNGAAAGPAGTKDTPPQGDRDTQRVDEGYVKQLTPITPVGHGAVNDLNRSQARHCHCWVRRCMRILRNKKNAFTLLEIVIIVCLLGILMIIASPYWLKSTAKSKTEVCIGNLRQIDSAKQQWALEHRQQATATPSRAELMPYIGRGAGEVFCPLSMAQEPFDGYEIGSVNAHPSCVYSNHQHNAYFTSTQQ